MMSRREPTSVDAGCDQVKVLVAVDAALPH
jgi:hypothetical protein